MNFLRFTLVSEGTTDKSLIPILKWAVQEQGIQIVQGQFASWHFLPKRPTTVVEKIEAGLKLYECDLLFIHRDSDNQNPKDRRDEIATAINEITASGRIKVPSIPVIPIRETEAWLLIDELAIRKAANNPNGKNDLKLPSLKNLESCTNPKKELRRVLRSASEWSVQRLKRFDTDAATARVVDYIPNFERLRKLSAFQNLETDLRKLRSNNWKS